MSAEDIPGSSCSRALPPSLRVVAGAHSLWRLNADELLDAIAAPEPTPGGGSVAILAACLGTALVRKAFAVSVRKDRGIGSTEEFLAALRDLRRHELILRESADRDAAAFDSYLHAVRLPHNEIAQAKIREKAIELALVRATCIPTSAAAAIRSAVTLALRHMERIHDVVLTDAVIGLNLLHTSAACLLVTAEENRRRIAQSAFCEKLASQAEELSVAIGQAEADLAARLR
ncbi:MAG: cyclodeaminase/cyclohydrolase family protein, partial [Acidobacteriaceae bacterium]